MRMQIGTRIVSPEEAGKWDADIVQISVYHGMNGNMEVMKNCAEKCRAMSIPFVIHPVGFSLLNDKAVNDMTEMSEITDLALILHDEKAPDGKRLYGEYQKQFMKALDALQSLTEVSIENATDTSDVRWFWNAYADSITLDIGHIESSGLDSVSFVRSLDEEAIKKVRFVHIHRNNGLHGGITDHWPLTSECREIEALKELAKSKTDISIILEINETEMIENNLSILKDIFNQAGSAS